MSLSLSVTLSLSHLPSSDSLTPLSHSITLSLSLSLSQADCPSPDIESLSLCFHRRRVRSITAIEHHRRSTIGALPQYVLSILPSLCPSLCLSSPNICLSRSVTLSVFVLSLTKVILFYNVSQPTRAFTIPIF
ncbi:hypothetical protein CsSME_00045942 [Camellia sinensis var. sinensis]